ncbi:MAG: NADPH:quinone oxidoreductase family protein [Chloroflexota bacterium]
MKAILCKEWGKPETLVLEEVPDPEPEPGQVQIDIHACGVNFADTLIIQGLYQEKPALPFTPGSEVAGTISALGEGVENFQVGDRVAALCSIGGMAERATAPAQSTMSMADSMPYTVAAGFAVAYGTSHVALEHRANLQPGETLLVHGAAGGVGLAAVEIGKAMGATVIATASSQAKLDVASAHGADHLINYSEGGFREEVKSLTGGKGADVIYDPVGGDVFDESLRCINWEGRILVIGFASGRIPKAPVNLTLVKNFSIVGIYWGAYAKRNPQVQLNSFARLMEWYEKGAIRPYVSATYSLDNASKALLDLMERRSTGKVVVETR